MADRSSTPRAFRAGVRIAAAIAVLLFVARLVTTRPETGARTDDTITLGLWPGLASAQTAPTTAGARRLPPLIGLRGDRLQPVVATYELRVQRAGVELTAPERARLVIAPDSSDGRAAWRIESGWLGHPTDLQERSFIDRATLAPLRRHALNVGHSRFTVDQRFTGDSVLGTMTTAQRGSAIAAALPRNHGPFLLGEAALVVLLRGLALRRGLEGSFALVGWAGVPSDVYYPVNLAVTGEDRVTIGRRPWDAWRVVVRIGSGRLTVWARKQDGAALRLRETIGDRDYDVTLVSEEVAR